MSTEEEIAAVLQRMYDDATQTVLDHQVARAIEQRMRELGWASLDEVAMLIEAAGGSVTVGADAFHRATRGESGKAVYREYAPHDMSVRYSVRGVSGE